MVYNKDKSKQTRKVISENKNWFAIGVLSLTVIALIPLFGSYMTGKTELPQTVLEWAIYITCSLSTAVCCLMIWLCMHNQGKINVKDEDEYIKAKELHIKNFLAETGKELVPINPFEWEKKAKVKKGIFQFVGIFSGLLGLGLGALTYNWATLVSGVIAVIMSLGFGIYHMGEVEKKFTEDYLEYELYMEKKIADEKKREELTNQFLEEQNEIICFDTNTNNLPDRCNN